MSSNTEEKEESNLSETQKNFRDRIKLPILITIVGAGLVALLGISFSRIFLAGSSTGSEGAEVAEGAAEHASKSSNPVLWASIITLVILLGAGAISLAKSMRPMSFKLILLGTVLVVSITGSIIYGSGEEPKAGAVSGIPTPEELSTADPANAIEVDALGNLTFSQNEYTVKPGVVNIKYIGVGGTHQLKFAGKFDWFDLVVNTGTEAAADVTLTEGDYVIFCPIPGHENMTANLHVVP